MKREEILQERLDRIRAIVNVLEQNGDIDLTTLTQLQLSLDWEPGQDNKNF